MCRKILLASLVVLFISSIVLAQVTVTFLDVGQGDSIYISTDEDVHILIDAGVKRAGEAVVVPYLRNEGIEEILMVVATHPHADHIGGLISVLRNFHVEKILADGQVHTTRTYENFLITVDQLDIPFIQAKAGMEFKLPGIDLFKVIHPQEEFLDGLNNNSVVIKMRVGDIQFLFTGDIEKQAEDLLLESNYNLDSSILKVAHHGSSSSSTKEFIEATYPKTSIIMAGSDNRYGHPHRRTLINLSDSDIYRTDHHGTVVISTDGQDYSINTTKTKVGYEARINITIATANDLTDIPGIGDVLANRIIDFRNEYGITKVEDLINVTGIGPATLERIKEYVYIK